VRVPGAAKERAVLVVLGWRAGTTVGVRELTDALWGDGPPVAASKTLQTYVSALRRRLPAGAISTVGAGYRLNVDVDTVDVFMFQHLVAAGQQALAAGDAEASVGSLRQALGLWRGDPLVELADQPWGMVETARLMEGRRYCQELLAEARLAAGEAASLVGDLEAAAAAEPPRERRWAQLKLALYRAAARRTPCAPFSGYEPS
jgi:DNA-binding SARP family transcriptional activator